MRVIKIGSIISSAMCYMTIILCRELQWDMKISRVGWYHRSHPCDGSRKTVDGEQAGGQGLRRGGRVGRAILIHLTNSLSMRYTERLPCAAAARTRSTYPGGTPAILAAWHPCGLIYGRALTSLGPHQPRRRRWCRTDAAALGRYGYDAARGSWASLKIYPSEWRGRESKEEWSRRDRQWLKYRSTSHEVQSNKERCFEMGEKIRNLSIGWI